MISTAVVSFFLLVTITHANAKTISLMKGAEDLEGFRVFHPDSHLRTKSRSCLTMGYIRATIKMRFDMSCRCPALGFAV